MKSLDYVVRWANPVDYDAIVMFYNLRGQKLLQSGHLSRHDEGSDEHRRLFDDRWVRTAIAVLNGRIIGAAQLCVQMKNRGKVAHIEYVLRDPDEEFRGQEIGDKLMLQLIVWAMELKVYKIRLTSAAHRVSARNLYERHGFRLEEGSKRHFELKLD